LSLVCSVLTWYTGKEPYEGKKVVESNNDGLDWMKNFGTTIVDSDDKAKNKPINRKRFYNELNSTDFR
jgi:hypothetical protein